MMTVQAIKAELEQLGDPEVAANLRWFFKAEPGGYGEGDRFRGIRVPLLWKLARRHQNLSLDVAERLLQSPFHEDRMVALMILVGAFEQGDEPTREQIYACYLRNTRFVNNWDLVDTSAEHIVGAFLWDRPRDPLYTLAASDMLWERRIAIMATFHFVKRDAFDETLRLAERLHDDPEDLIHKAVGWMLREIGKRDLAAEEEFLRVHYQQMPRTMLRYAIEKFPEPRRQAYLKGTI